MGFCSSWAEADAMRESVSKVARNMGMAATNKAIRGVRYLGEAIFVSNDNPVDARMLTILKT